MGHAIMMGERRGSMPVPVDMPLMGQEHSADAAPIGGSGPTPTTGRTNTGHLSLAPHRATYQTVTLRGMREAAVAKRSPHLEKAYVLGKVLGEGTFGSVNVVTDRVSGNQRAVKTVEWPSVQEEQHLDVELQVLASVQHPNLLQFFGLYMDMKWIYIVTEICDGGELLDRILELKIFNERQAGIVMKQICRAVRYLHMNDICHRDIKPENFLFATKDAIDVATLKLIDYGRACYVKDGRTLHDREGTLLYMAPEVLQRSYTINCDVWSCGVILFVLLQGRLPFTGPSLAAVERAIVAGDYMLSAGSLSDAAVEFLVSMLCPAGDRMSLEQLSVHRWLVEVAPTRTVSISDTALANLRAFRTQGKFQKMAMNLCANALQPSDIENLREVFLQLDDNGDGQLSITELEAGLKDKGHEALLKSLREARGEIDVNGDGMISYQEFLAATCTKKVTSQEKVCWSAFRMLDLDGDGIVTAAELFEVCKGKFADHLEHAFGCSMDAVQPLLAEADADGDGMISFPEFMSVLRGEEFAIV